MGWLSMPAHEPRSHSYLTHSQAEIAKAIDLLPRGWRWTLLHYAGKSLASSMIDLLRSSHLLSQIASWSFTDPFSLAICSGVEPANKSGFLRHWRGYRMGREARGVWLPINCKWGGFYHEDMLDLEHVHY